MISFARSQVKSSLPELATTSRTNDHRCFSVDGAVVERSGARANARQSHTMKCVHY